MSTQETSSAAPSVDLDAERLSIERLDKLAKTATSTRLLAVVLVVSTILVTIGLVVLWQQNQRIETQRLVIEAQRAEIELAAAKLAREVRQIDSESPDNQGAIAAAQSQAAAVEEQIRTSLAPGIIAKAPENLTVNDVLLTEGLSTGWDIDVFWCENSKSGENYEVAAIVADTLAALSASRQMVAPGMRLGQVELRAWRRDFNSRNHNGLSVVSDRGDGEDEARNALIGLLNERLDIRFAQVKSSGNLTPYYLSIFACDQ